MIRELDQKQMKIIQLESQIKIQKKQKELKNQEDDSQKFSEIIQVMKDALTSRDKESCLALSTFFVDGLED